MNLQRTLILLVALAALCAVWVLRAPKAAEPGEAVSADERPPASPAQPEALAALAPPAAVASGEPVRAAPRVTPKAAPEPAPERPAKRPPSRSETRRPERPAEATPPTGGPYALFSVSVVGRGAPVALGEVALRRDVRVELRLQPSDAVAQGSVPLGRSAELRIGLAEFHPTLFSGASVLAVADHPGYARFEGVVPLGSPRIVPGDHGTDVPLFQVDLTLEPYRALLTGEVSGATHVALALYSGLRKPEPLGLADLAPVQAGRYSLRAPRPGDWVVIALRERQHPRYAIVTVGADGDAVPVPFKLRPFATSLRVLGRAPADFDPREVAVALAPFADDLEPPGIEATQSAARPALTWHPTVAAAPDGDGFGVDLRPSQPELQLRDAIVWRSTRATFDGGGQAVLHGGPTGVSLLLVERPFVPGAYFEEPRLVPQDFVQVALAVARLDITASGPEGRLAFGVVEAQAWPRTTAARRPRRGAGPGVTRTLTLDADGRGALFVPSDEDLRVTVRDAPNRASVTQVERAFGKATQQTRVYTAAPGSADVGAPRDDVEWFVGPESVRSGDGQDG